MHLKEILLQIAPFVALKILSINWKNERGVQDYYVRCNPQIVEGKHIHTDTWPIHNTQGEGERTPAMNHKLFIPLHVKKWLSGKVLATKVLNHFVCVNTVNKSESVIG